MRPLSPNYIVKILPEIDGKTINEILAGDPDKVNLQLAYYIRTYDGIQQPAHRIISLTARSWTTSRRLRVKTQVLAGGL